MSLVKVVDGSLRPSRADDNRNDEPPHEPNGATSGPLAAWFRRTTWVDGVLWVLRIFVILLVGAGVWLSLSHTPYGTEQWISFALFGLTIGSIYALVSLGYTMVYGVLRMINFAHGDVFMAGSFGAYILATHLAADGVTASSPMLAILAIVLGGSATSAVIAAFVERFAYRPFRHQRTLAPLICAIGVSFILQYSVRGLFGTGSRGYPDIAWLDGELSLGFIAAPKAQLFVIVAAVLAMILLHLVVSRTRVGKAMRAVAEDRDTAALMGIDSGRIIAITFLMGGAMAGAAGVLYALVFKQIHAFMGFFLGIKGFAAAVLGGIGNIPGAMVGGFIMGLVEGLGPAGLLDGFGIPAPYQLRDAISYAMLVMVLIFLPRGLFGERLAVKRM